MSMTEGSKFVFCQGAAPDPAAVAAAAGLYDAPKIL